MSALDTALDATAAPVERTLAEDEVLLSSGKVAKLTRTVALHGHRSDTLMRQAGFPYHPSTFLRVQCLLAIVSIDGVRQPWPRPKKAEIEKLLARYSTADLEALATRYRALNEPPRQPGHIVEAGGL